MSEKVGYARVSTAQQQESLKGQIEQLEQLGCTRVFSDVASGSKGNRSGLAAALEYLRTGDTLIVVKLDRLGRSLVHTVNTLEQLEQRGIGFTALDFGMDTSTDLGKAYMNLALVFAEMERTFIRERTQAGLERAAKQGKTFGRPPRLSPTARQYALEALESGKSVAEVAEVHGVSRWTIQRLRNK